MNYDQTRLALEILDYVHRMSPRIEEILIAFNFGPRVKGTILLLIASGDIIIDEGSGRCDIR